MDGTVANKNLPPLNWLRAFEASARHLSFTNAARELHMTQSAVSQQIKSLENYLGKPLFHRRTRALELTEAAMTYLPTVQEAFAALLLGTRALVGVDRDQVLEVQSNLAFSVFWLTPRLGRLFERHPWINVNITTAIWAPERTAAAADIEIRFGRSEWEGNKGERLTSGTFFPVCAPGAEAELTDIDALLDKRLFDCSGLLCNWERWLGGQGYGLPAGKVVNWATTFVVSLAAAQAGIGVAMAHEAVAEDLLKRGLLTRPFDFALPMEEAYYLITPPSKSASPAVAAFAEWIEEEARQPLT